MAKKKSMVDEAEFSDIKKKKKKKKAPEEKASKKSQTKKKKKKSSSDEPKEKRQLIPYNKDSYVILDIDEKATLGYAFTKGKAMLEKGIEDEETVKTVKFEDSQVLACLGNSPKPGTSAFGITIHPYEKTMKVKGWGQIHLYLKMKNRELRYLKECIENVMKVLKKHKATDFLPLAATKVYVPAKKEFAYSARNPTKNNPDAPTDTFSLMPETFKEKEYLTSILYKGCAVGIWKHQVPEDIKARWVAMFSKRTEVHTVDQATLDSMHDNLVSYLEENPGAWVKDFKSNVLEPEDAVILDSIFSKIKRIHYLSDKEILNVLKQRGVKKFSTYWPDSTDFSEQVADINEDSAKSVEALFINAFVYHVDGRSLPKDVSKLIVKTLKNLVRSYK